MKRRISVKKNKKVVVTGPQIMVATAPGAVFPHGAPPAIVFYENQPCSVVAWVETPYGDFAMQMIKANDEPERKAAAYAHAREVMRRALRMNG